ncbi:response regulator transcription factor [Streptomyces monashensis]|uniref:response regulator transcription factor n=1 Tax=Streptomyces monashensis TaxID=1678012 RepID=UPI0015A70850|nr:response regulator transcription factor [Streptomyces monashensis]
MRIMLVEDDLRVLRIQSELLNRHGFQTSLARNYDEAMIAMSSNPDLAIVDDGLPGRGGLELCSRIRRTTKIPVIVVSSQTDPESRLRGFRAGADDYVCKPYFIPELLARINAILERTRVTFDPEPQVEAYDELRVGALVLDGSRRTLSVNGVDTHVKPREFDLLWYLASHADVVVRREVLARHLWRADISEVSRSLEVHIAILRGKIRRSGVEIRTLRGVGYRIVETGENPKLA